MTGRPAYGPESPEDLFPVRGPLPLHGLQLARQLLHQVLQHTQVPGVEDTLPLHSKTLVNITGENTAVIIHNSLISIHKILFYIITFRGRWGNTLY